MGKLPNTPNIQSGFDLWLKNRPTDDVSGRHPDKYIYAGFVKKEVGFSLD